MYDTLVTSGYKIIKSLSNDVHLCSIVEPNSTHHHQQQLCVVKKTDQTSTCGYPHSANEALCGEIALLQSISHPKIVSCIDTFQDLKHHQRYIVLEYCQGGDLLDLLQQRMRQSSGMQLPSLSVAATHSRRQHIVQCCQWMKDIVSAVAHLHHLHIAHMDISLENVLVQDGQCKLSDFGFSVYGKHSLKNWIHGKPYYIAPEMYGTRAYRPLQCDIWSLGVLFYIVLTGMPLFEQATVDDVTFRFFKRFGLQVLLKQQQIRLPSPICKLLERMLHVQPTQRPKAMQLCQAFDALITYFSRQEEEEVL